MNRMRTAYEFAISILNERRSLYFSSLILVILTLVMSGGIYGMQNTAEEEAEELEITYGNKKYFSMGESISDKDYINYVRDDTHVWYERLCDFGERLRTSKYFTYIATVEQPIYVIDTEIEDKFLDGYEYGYGEGSIMEMDGETMYFAKAIEVSESFFDDMPISLVEGTGFDSSDYELENVKNEIPILMGSEYREYFDIGDVLKGDYMGPGDKLIIKGFIDKDCYYINGASEEMVSLSRYIIAPAFNYKPEDIDTFATADTALLQEMNGRIVAELSFEQLDGIIKTMLDESGLGSWDIGLIDMSLRFGSELDSYSHMTKEVARQFSLLVNIMMVITCVSIVIILLGILREEHENFGIMLLCGGGLKTIAMIAIWIVAGIVLIGDIVASLMILAVFGAESALIVQIPSILTIIVCVSVCIFYIKRMNISEIIGGKE